MKETAVYFIITLVIWAAIGSAQETLYPEGYNIVSNYMISSNDISTEDTLTITRTIKNNETFTLHNLYLTDNLPQEFEITSYSLNLNGEPITNYFSGPLFNQVIPNYITYRWVIDDPNPNDELNHFVDPDDSLELTYRIICQTNGDYTLPFHTLCFYGNLTGFFTTSDSINISVFEDNLFGFITGVVTTCLFRRFRQSIPSEADR